MLTRIKCLSYLFCCLISINIYGQHHITPSQTESSENPASRDFKQAMDTMHLPMMNAINTTDPDHAFVEGMIPHHQGAIDMARIVLKYGKDPEIRKLAEGIIKAQENEISWMRQWLKNHPTTK